MPVPRPSLGLACNPLAVIFLILASTLYLLPALHAAAIHEAAKQGDLDALSPFVTRGEDLDAVDENGQAPLNLAVAAGHKDFAALLVSMGAAVEGSSSQPSPLWLACHDGRTAIIQNLLTDGAATHRASGPPHAPTPLMVAAAQGHADAVDLLLRFGADPQQEVNGLTAGYVAEKAGFSSIASALSQASPNQPAPPIVPTGSVLRPEPGTRLLPLSQNAPSGATIHLQEGEYIGPLAAIGKKLTVIGPSGGEAAIKGDPGSRNACLVVDEQAELVLRDVTLLPQGEQSALFLKNSAATLVNARVRASQGYAIYLDTSRLRLFDCRISEGQSIGIAGVANASVTAVRCDFSNMADTSIFVQKDSHLAVLGCHFESLAKAAINARENCIVEVADSRFQQVQQPAVSIDGATHAIVRDNAFVQCGNGATLNNTALAIAVRNRMSDSPQALAFFAQLGGPLVIADNQAEGVQLGLSVNQASQHPLTISRNTFLDTDRGGIYLNGGGGASKPRLEGNLVVRAAKVGILLNEGVETVMTGNVAIVEGEAMALSIQENSKAMMAGNTLASPTAAINFYHSGEAPTILREEMLLGPMLGESQTLKTDRHKQFEVFLNEENQRAKAAELADRIRASSLDALPGASRELARFRAEAASSSQSVAKIAFALVDEVGASQQVAFEVFQEDDTDLAHPIAQANAKQSVHLSPGAYWIVPHGKVALAQPVTIDPGQQSMLSAKVDQALWLQFHDRQSDGPLPLLVELRPTKDRAAPSQWIRPLGPYPHDAAMLRPDASLEDLAAARPIARDAYLETRLEPTPPTSDDPLYARRFFTDRNLKAQWGAALLALAGEPEDVQWIAQNPDISFNPSMWIDLAKLLGHIEARKGNLDSGLLKTWLGHSDPIRRASAALAFRELGSSAGDRVLRELLADPEPLWFAFRPAWAMLSDPHPDTLQAMRSGFKKLIASASAENPTRYMPAGVPMACHLLTHGEHEDIALLSEFTFDERAAFFFMAYARDPAPLAEFLVRQGDAFPHSLFYVRKAGSLFADRSESESLLLATQLNALLALHHAQRSNSRSAYRNSINTSVVYQTFLYPSSAAVQHYGAFGRNQHVHPTDPERSDLSSDARWFYALDDVDTVVRSWDLGYTHHLHHLDLIPLEQIKKSVDSLDAPPPAWDLFRFYRKVATRQHLSEDHHMPMGEAHFPYVFEYREEDGSYGGGLNGVADVTAAWRDSALQIRIKLRQESYYHDIGSLAGMIGRDKNKNLWGHHHFFVNGGRALIDSVHIRRGTEVIQASDTGSQDDGYFIFEATMPSPALDNLWLDVNLKFLKQPIRALTEPLYWGELGRAIRSQRERARLLAQRADENRNDAQAQLDWANASLTAGMHQEARTAFLRTLQLYPNETLAIQSAQALEGRRDPDGAAAFLAQALRLLPSSPSLAAELPRIYYRAGRYDEGAGVARELLAQYPGDPALSYSLASCLTLLGQHADALQASRQIADDFAPDYTALLRYLNAHLAQDGSAQDETRRLDSLISSLDRPAQQAAFQVLRGSKDIHRMVDQENPPAPATVLYCMAGYHELIRGRPDRAASRFQSAIDAGEKELLEYKLASAELSRLPSP